jgi:hypothetical protein
MVSSFESIHPHHCGVAKLVRHQILIRKCTRCSEEKPLSEFSFRDKERGRLSSWCKRCLCVHNNKKYKECDRRRADVRRNRERNNAKVRQYVWDYLLSRSCVVCGECDPIVLDFDHINRKEKCVGIADAIRAGYSIENISVEIQKCQVLCANCHRRKTAKEFGWWSPD